jgi:hypothetical protein
MDDRMSVFIFAENEQGHVQAVISESDLPVFIALGFAKTVDDIEPPKAAKNGSKDDK